MLHFRRVTALLLSIPLLLPALSPSQNNSLAARRERLRTAIDAEWQYELRTHPEMATEVGDSRYNGIWSDYSAAAQIADHEHARRQVHVFEAIATAGFAPQEKLSKLLMIRQLRQYAESEPFKDWEMPVDQYNGIQVAIPSTMHDMPLRTVQDYDNYLSRLHKIPLVLEQAVQNMRLGIGDHLMPPFYLLEKAAAEAQDIATRPLTASPFAAPLKQFPNNFTQSDRIRLTLGIQSAIHNEVAPAYARFAAFVKNDYGPHGRTEDGIWALPDGAARYRYDVRVQTTTRLTAKQIHEMGVKQVFEIEAEMLKLARSQGYRDLASFNDHIRHDRAL
jgi:uncharacterized protein (DUF885 family)